MHCLGDEMDFHFHFHRKVLNVWKIPSGSKWNCLESTDNWKKLFRDELWEYFFPN